MNKKLLLIIIAIIVIIVIVLLLFMFFKKNRKNDPDKILDSILKEEYSHGELVSIRFIRDSSYHGGKNHIEVIKDDDYKLVTEYSYEIGYDLEVVEYKITEEDFKELEEYVIKYNLPSWDRFGPPLYEELDGDFVDLSFTYKEESNGKMRNNIYTVGYDQNFPDRGVEILKKFTDKMQSLKKDENIIKEYKREDV